MKKLLIVLFFALSLPTGEAEACMTNPGTNVGKVRSVVRQSLLAGEYVLSFRVTWKKRHAKGVFYQGIRLHRRIKVLSTTGRTLSVKAKGAAPAHTVVAFSRGTAWVNVKVRVAKKDRKEFLRNYKNKDLTMWRQAGKKGAAYGEHFAPGDGRPKGCATPGSPKWIAKKAKAKASDF